MLHAHGSLCLSASQAAVQQRVQRFPFQTGKLRHGAPAWVVCCVKGRRHPTIPPSGVFMMGWWCWAALTARGSWGLRLALRSLGGSHLHADAAGVMMLGALLPLLVLGFLFARSAKGECFSSRHIGRHLMLLSSNCACQDFKRMGWW